jgi:hypothetical protein
LRRDVRIAFLFVAPGVVACLVVLALIGAGPGEDFSYLPWLLTYIVEGYLLAAIVAFPITSS